MTRKADILDAAGDHRYGKDNRGRDLPDELRRRQDRLEPIRQARKEMEAETTAAAAARERQEEADKARAEADAAKHADVPTAEQTDLNKRAEAAAATARAGSPLIDTGLPNPPGLIQSVSQALLPGLRAWVEVGGIAPSQCPKAFLPQPNSI